MRAAGFRARLRRLPQHRFVFWQQGRKLKGLYRKQFLPGGLPNNDRFVEQTIVSGRGMMPGLGDPITEQQVDDLVAYLHTL